MVVTTFLRIVLAVTASLVSAWPVCAFAADPAADRGLLFPTAETLPRGRWSVTTTDAMLWETTYAFNDSMQATVVSSIIPPGGALVLGLKWRVWQDDNTAVTAIAGLGGGLDITTEWRVLTPSLAVAASRCLPQTCKLRIHGFVMASAFISTRGSDELGVAGGSLDYQIGRHVKLMVGAYATAVAPEPVMIGLLIPYGIRIAWPHFAVDFGAALPVGLKGMAFPTLFLWGTPLVSLTAGW
ncbi:MAG: hypothetical protein V2A73_15530 [Pseudomonadota bacterium]